MNCSRLILTIVVLAAGAVIIKEATGVLLDWTGKSGWLLGKRILAGNESIRKFLEGEVRAIF